MDTTSDQLDYEENIFDKIKRLDLGQKSIGDVVKEIDTLRADNAALRARLARLVEYLQKAPHQMGCSSLQDKVPREKYGSLELCDCWKIEAIAAVERHL